MGYRREREEFIERMTREGLPLDVTLRLLREATGLNRRAELACSSEAADRDRVPCPQTANAKRPCLCDGAHDNGRRVVTRIAVQDWQAEERIRLALHDVNMKRALVDTDGPDAPDTIHLWQFTTAGDPRGYVLRVIPPSYAERNKGRDRFNLDAVGVPNGPSRLRW